MNKKEKIKLISIFIVILIFKIIIVQVQPINAKYTMKYDDQLMVNMTENIIQGKWLGEYNYLILIKGVFTPIFMAMMYLLKIPFLVGKEIFYGIACIIFTLIISKKIKSKIILTLIYLAILMNPVEYSAEMCRAYRDGIYISLVMYFLSFAFAIFLNRKENVKRQIKYYIGLGISFSAIYLCREETIWLLKFIVIILLITIIPIKKDKNLKDKKTRLLLFLIPIIITIILVNIICIINYKYYGVYTLNQYWGTSFKKAYGALTRVIPNEKIKRVPVTKESMQRIYEISPKFKELEDFFEGEMGKKWEECGQNIEGEINGGYFHWALMNAVEQKGYYKDAKSADEYYRELAKEINDACDSGKINGRKNKRISNTCYFDYKDIIDVLKEIKNTIKFQSKLRNVKVIVSNEEKLIGIEDEEEIRAKFEKITNQKIVSIDYYDKNINNIRLKILELNKNIYTLLNPHMFYASLICAIIFVLINIKEIKKYYEECVILISLFIMYITRIFIITFTKELMYVEALNVSYLSSIYNIQCIFTTFTFIYLISNIVNKTMYNISNKKQKLGEENVFNNINTSIK